MPLTPSIAMPVELPDDPNLLAQIVASDPDLRCRNAAFGRLLGWIVPIADRVALRYRKNHPAPADKVAEKAPLLIRFRLLTSGTFDPDRGEFGGWCRTILEHATDTLIRRMRVPKTRADRGEADEDRQTVLVRPPILLEARGGPDPSAGDLPPEPADAQSLAAWRERQRAGDVDGEDPRRVRLQEMTRLLLEIGWAPKRAVDLYAVLLLWVRAEVAHCGCRAADGAGDPDVGAEALIALVTEGLPWTESQQALRIRRELPELLAVWQGVCQDAASPNVWNGDGFHPALASFLTRRRTGGAEITRSQSERWKVRARENGRRKIRQHEPGAWEAYFADLWETRHDRS